MAALRGYFQSVDGRYRWHGRLAAPADTPDALDVLAGARHQAVLVTPDGMSRCDVYEQDLWGRFKVSGVGRPPFTVDMDAARPRLRGLQPLLAASDRF